MEKVLLTGMAGFIGYHLTKELISNGFEVIGIDNLSNSYDIQLKIDRLKELGFSTKKIIDNKQITSNISSCISFYKGDICDEKLLTKIFKENNISYVVNLAAYAGLRDSIDNPSIYIESNIVGFSKLIEISARNNVKHFLYASSSSVYGYTKEEYFEETQSCEKPLNLYAATKKSNELLAHVYSNLYSIPTTGLRFFNVYGEYGRPDMAPYIFTNGILIGEPFTLNNKGEMYRDLVYVGEIVESIRKLLLTPSKKEEEDNLNKSSICPYRIVNIGSSHCIKLIEFISIIEEYLNKKAVYIEGSPHKSEALKTLAATDYLNKIINFKPTINFKEGIKKYIDWHLSYYS